MSAADLDKLFTMAQTVRERAYAPYSQFKVGVALRSADDHYFAGCNVENIVFGSTQCAEVNAVGCFIAAGASQITDCLIIGGGENICPPCGNSRQVLAEFATKNTKIHLCTAQGVQQTLDLEQLLPLRFSSIDD